MSDKFFQFLHRTFHDTVLQMQSIVQQCSSLDYHGQLTTLHPLYKLQEQSGQDLFHHDRFLILTNLLRLILLLVSYILTFNFNSNERKTAGNMRLAIAGGQWLIEVLCFYQTSVLADKLVLLNARHRQAQNR